MQQIEQVSDQRWPSISSTWVNLLCSLRNIYKCPYYTPGWDPRAFPATVWFSFCGHSRVVAVVKCWKTIWRPLAVSQAGRCVVEDLL